MKRYTLTEGKLRNLVNETIQQVLREYTERNDDLENEEALAQYIGCNTEEVVERQENFYEAGGQEWYVFDSEDDARYYIMNPNGYDAASFMESCWRDGQEFYEWLEKNPNSAVYYDMEKVFPDLQNSYSDEVYNDETGEYEEVEYDPRELGMEYFTNRVDWDYVAQVVLDADGPQWYLAGYDGQQVDLPNGAVGYRHN